MKAIILAAGYGTRLGALTEMLPKPMLPLEGKPLLEYSLRYLASEGVTDLAINLHFMPDRIRGYFGDGRDWGVSIHYTNEPELLGTAGAIKNFESWIGDAESFLVLYGDLLTNQPLAPLWEIQRRTDALAALVVHRRRRSNSVIVTNAQGRITEFLERPDEAVRAQYPDETWVNSGIQVLSRRVLDILPPGQHRDLPRDVYVPMHTSQPLVTVPLTGYRCAIDSPERYRQAGEAVRKGLWILGKRENR